MKPANASTCHLSHRNRPGVLERREKTKLKMPKGGSRRRLATLGTTVIRPEREITAIFNDQYSQKTNQIRFKTDKFVSRLTKLVDIRKSTTKRYLTPLTRTPGSVRLRKFQNTSNCTKHQISKYSEGGRVPGAGSLPAPW